MGDAREAKTEGGREKRHAARSGAAPAARPSLSRTDRVLQLQRTIGNQAVRRLFTGDPVQPKLSVGPAGDRYEREADRVADEVMRDLSATVAPAETEMLVRGSPVDHEVGLEGGPLGADTEARIQRRRGGGAPLPARLQQSMGQSFGADFGSVRVHTGPAADDLSRSMQARAFTVGSDIFLARGQYQPHTAAGQHLLAHELTHTVQQGAVGRTTMQAADPDAVQRITVDSDEPKDWANLTTGRASGGVTGVIFATAPNNTEVVVKGLVEPPQRVMLAQAMMADQGVGTTNTRPVPVSSKLGKRILQELVALGGRLTGAGDAQGAAITTKATAWQGYQTLLLMAPVAVKNFSQLATSGPGLAPVPVGGPAAVGFGGARAAVAQAAAQDLAQHVTFWTNLVANQQMWESFGKIFYIDQFLGNEDRFETLKIQNIFIDPTTFQAVALDNDTQAAAYISTITEIDAITTPRTPTTNIVNLTPDDYIRNTVNGGWIYNNTALQARAVASLDQISGASGAMAAKVAQKVTDLLTTLNQGVANGHSANDQAAHQVLTAALNNTNNALTTAQQAMAWGATRARARLQELARADVNAQSFRGMFERQLKQYGKGYDTKSDVLYDALALEIRYVYLAYRTRRMDHNAALAQVQGEYRDKVARASKVAITNQTADPYNPQELTKLK